MDLRNRTQRAPAVGSAGMDHSEEMLAEMDEPPEGLKAASFWSSSNLSSDFAKSTLHMRRRESLLTRQIYSEAEHTDDEPISPARNLSTQSTWSTTSACELTSDDGHSVPSPALSPPLPPTYMHTTLPALDKPLEQKVQLVATEDVPPPTQATVVHSEKTVEANLGRKRCISFACRGQEDNKPVQAPKVQTVPPEPKSPPKRKCMLKFVCPNRADAESKTTANTQTRRPVSPPPPERRPSAKHRGSDSTVTHVSPKATRKDTCLPATPPAVQTPPSVLARKYSNESDSDSGNEATRFHEFATSEDEQESWVQESTCHRNRLTVNDTLQKENIIRKTCQEAEEEVLAEEEEQEEEEEEEELKDELVAEDDRDEDDMDPDEENESDDGFHSDDEDGFANSDSENDDSDFEWWKPGGMSTAATSVDHLDRLAIVNSQQRHPASSVGSASSGRVSPHVSRRRVERKTSAHSQTPAMAIHRPGSPELPDSTDFVCGTLDEDRPLEQAYINRKKFKEAAKRNFRPQDIDPTFPQSDPEMDEEDDDDVDEVDVSESDKDDMMHGQLDELHGNLAAKRRPSPRPRSRHNLPRSPPPPTTRLQSPPPSRQRAVLRSPPPPPRRNMARSPAPRKLFGHSPNRRSKSPASAKRMTSPPNSPTERSSQHSTALQGLAGRPRPQLTHTSSLPRGGGITISKLATIASGGETSDTNTIHQTAVPKRGAIDIVKGLERKRQRRKEKLYQKLCAKAANKGEKAHRVKPGKGAERMREVGLGLHQYKGKAEWVMSL